MDNEQLKPPEFIFLQDYDTEECTWCEDRIDESDIMYVIASEYHALRDELKAVRDLIIEADAQYNTGKLPGDFDTASMALVTMAAHGSQALAEVARLTAELEAVAAAGQRHAELAISLYQELQQAREFHPRAMKLIGKHKDFIVIAEDEPYFVDAYMAIRRHEKFIKRWTAEDEQRYREAFTRWHQAQTNALPTPPEQEANG